MIRALSRIVQLLSLAGLLTIASGFATAVDAAEKAAPDAKQKVAPANISQSVSRSYNADANLQLGMMVRLKPTDKGTVEPVKQSDINGLLGVIVPANESTITLTPSDSKTKQVFVASNGRFLTLVSNQNGPIKAGDAITISALAGIGMRADANQPIILGRAITDFNGSSNVVGKVTVKDQAGKSRDVSISRITVSVSITTNPLASRENDKVPEFLNKAAIGLVGKPVSAARIYLGLVTLLVSAFVAANLVYSGVRNGMIAIGRNPLSRKSIFRSLFQTVIAGLIVFFIGVLSVYVLLKV